MIGKYLKQIRGFKILVPIRYISSSPRLSPLTRSYFLNNIMAPFLHIEKGQRDDNFQIVGKKRRENGSQA